MTETNNEKKCAFGVFLDIVDSLQEMNKIKIPQAGIKKCSFCSKELESTANNCCYYGKAQPV